MRARSVMMACRIVAVCGAAIAFLGTYGAFANEPSYVKTSLSVRQVEMLWAVP